MDARERAEKIAVAYWAAIQEARLDPVSWDAISPAIRFEVRCASEAAVNEAYRIDGVGELVEAAFGALRRHIDPEDCQTAECRLREAAARVRGAMGGGE